MRIHRDERGQTIILVALSLPLLLGFIGIATDVGALFKDKRTMQTAADAAAIAGALNYKNNTWHSAAITAATANGFTAGTGVTVDPENGPLWPASNYFQKTGYIEVTITKREPTIFLSLFGYPSVTVQARAVAGTGPGTGCLYTTGPTGTTFTYNGGGNGSVNAPNCGLVVESNGNPAMVVNGNATVTLGSIGVVGTYSGHSPNVSPTPVAGIAPESDPLNYLPQYTFTNVTTGKGKNATTTYSVGCTTGYDCSRSSISGTTTCLTNNSTGYTAVAGTTLMPGCYANLTFPNSGTVTLSPGLYVVDGDLALGNGNVNGNGVTLYYGGNLSFGSGTYNLSAPNDASLLWNGVILAEDISDTSGITFGGNSNTVINGVVYAPGTPFTMHGTPNITLNADFVVQKMTLDGAINFTSYAALSGVASPLSTVALVE